MNEPLDELYLEWLYSQVGSVRTRDRSRTYWSLLRQLFRTEFVWFIPNDDNRVEDGRDLRLEFINARQIEDADDEWLSLGCSFLEMLIALSRKLSFEAGGRASDWFWRLIENLRLIGCTDSDYTEAMGSAVDSIINAVIFRQYDHDGHGGLFPLERPENDQRKIEIWYQMSAYLIENEYA